jgi:hypothetical protein
MGIFTYISLISLKNSSKRIRSGIREETNVDLFKPCLSKLTAFCNQHSYVLFSVHDKRLGA